MAVMRVVNGALIFDLLTFPYLTYLVHRLSHTLTVLSQENINCQNKQP